MDKRAFDDLLKSARDMGRHMHGKRVPGVRETVVEEPDASSVGDAVGVSQRDFANLVGVPCKTGNKRGRDRRDLPALCCGRSPKIASMSCGRLQPEKGCLST